MTRAVLALLKGDLAKSMYWHPMVLPTLVLALAFLWAWYRQKKTWMRVLVWIWVFCMLACWGYRLLFVFGHTPMAYTEHSLIGYLLGFW